MSANLENSAMASGLEKVNLHPNPKEGQCWRMFKLLYNCAHLKCQQSNAQNPSSQASTIYKLRPSRCTSWISKRQRNQRSNCQHLLYHGEKVHCIKICTSASLTVLKPLTVWITTNCGNFLKRQNTRPPYLPPKKPVCSLSSNSQNQTWNN